MITVFPRNFWQRLAVYLQQAQLQAELGAWYQSADQQTSPQRH
jgi:hypothetical protein